MVNEALEIFQRNLPHWRLTGSTYFITFTLAQNQPELSSAERDLLQDILRHDHPDRYHLWAWAVMNDHVHAVMTPCGEWQLNQILHTWKSFSANRLQRMLRRKGQVWLHESHDRLVRNESEFFQKCEYVLNNPQKRWPDTREYPWCGFNFSEAK